MRSPRSVPYRPRALLLATLVALFAGPAAADEVRDLRWPELIPGDLADAPVRPPTVDHSGPVDLTQLSPWGDLDTSALLVPDLDGVRVRISGFVVPLNLTAGDRVDAFLLVPYFGACIHVPPPPPNQVIHVTSEPGLDAAHIHDPWTVTGTLRVDPRESALAEAGYSLEASGIRLYAQ